jgi:outer membrane scaffolding protein for murein synthesis (MipA/OmpV family)
MRKDSIKTRRAPLLAGALLACSVSLVGAGENWTFVVGGGGYVSNVYGGSDESFIAPMPIAQASYKTGNLEFSASILDGIGINYLDEERHFLAGVGVNFGEGRDSEEYSTGLYNLKHSKETERFLDGSPTVSSIVRSALTIGWLSPVGVLGASLKYQPTTLEGDTDEFFHAFLPSAFWRLPVPVSEKLMITGMLEVEFMNKGFADAWYTVDTMTTELDTFEAEAGLRDIRFCIQADYMFTEHIGATFLAENSFLLMDGADSPYTRSRYQLTSGLGVFFTF